MRIYPFHKNSVAVRRKNVAGRLVNGLPEKNKNTQEKVTHILVNKANFLLNMSLIRKYETATTPVDKRVTKNLIAYSPRPTLKNKDDKSDYRAHLI